MRLGWFGLPREGEFLSGPNTGRILDDQEVWIECYVCFPIQKRLHTQRLFYEAGRMITLALVCEQCHYIASVRLLTKNEIPTYSLDEEYEELVKVRKEREEKENKETRTKVRKEERMRRKKGILVQRIHSIRELRELGREDADYRQLAIVAAENLGGKPKSWEEAIKWLILIQNETDERGTLDEINGCRDLI
jgi:hypothetical protein